MVDVIVSQNFQLTNELVFNEVLTRIYLSGRILDVRKAVKGHVFGFGRVSGAWWGTNVSPGLRKDDASVSAFTDGEYQGFESRQIMQEVILNFTRDVLWGWSDIQNPVLSMGIKKLSFIV